VAGGRDGASGAPTVDVKRGPLGRHHGRHEHGRPGIALSAEVEPLPAGREAESKRLLRPRETDERCADRSAAAEVAPVLLEDDPGDAAGAHHHRSGRPRPDDHPASVPELDRQHVAPSVEERQPRVTLRATGRAAIPESQTEVVSARRWREIRADRDVELGGSARLRGSRLARVTAEVQLAEHEQRGGERGQRESPAHPLRRTHSTVTVLARFRGWSTLRPRRRAMR
jgi:hypothetical protein